MRTWPWCVIDRACANVVKATLWCVLGVLSLLAAPAHAQVDRELAEMFGSMSNVTRPGAHMGQRRGVITGGSITLRNRIVRPGPLLSLDPPTIESGCGGIDLFAGSLSAVSMDAFKDYLRAIASNASGYAFELGLNAICPDCRTIMSNLGNVVRQYNFQAMDSCQVAQGMVNAMAGTGEARRAENSSAFSRLAGFSRDYFSAGNPNQGDESPTASNARERPETSEKILGGNAIWEAMKQTGWGRSASSRFKEDVLSLTGAIVQCVPGTGSGCPELTSENAEDVDRQPPTYRLIEPTLRLRELVFGSADDQPVYILSCRGDSKCLDPSPTANPTYNSFERTIREALTGPSGIPQAGIIYKIRHNFGTPTARELSLLNAGGTFTGMVMRLAKLDETAAMEFAIEFAPQIAAEIAANQVRDLLREVQRALTASRSPLMEAAQLQVAKVSIELDRDADAMARDTQTKAQILAYFQILSTSLPSRKTPELSVDVPSLR